MSFDREKLRAPDPLIGAVLDRRFRIDARIASGGFGSIYRATRLQTNTSIAIKVLHPQLAADPGVVRRFRREGETLTRLRSPHTIFADELGEADGVLFIVLELLHGETLSERYHRRGQFDWRRMAAIARGVCHSLEEAHGLGIIHRDLSPANISLETRDGSDEFVKVLDFGIAKILRGSELDSSDLTKTGQTIGTLDYMAPEQLLGGACTEQTDIYTLAIVMYEMIAGRRPFDEATSPSSSLVTMMGTTPDSLASHAPVPAELDRIVMKCLDPSPAQRLRASELGAELDLLLADPGLAIRDDTEPLPSHVPGVAVSVVETGSETTNFNRARFADSATHPNAPPISTTSITAAQFDEPPTDVTGTPIPPPTTAGFFVEPETIVVRPPMPEHQVEYETVVVRPSVHKVEHQLEHQVEHELPEVKTIVRPPPVALLAATKPPPAPPPAIPPPGFFADAPTVIIRVATSPPATPLVESSQHAHAVPANATPPRPERILPRHPGRSWSLRVWIAFVVVCAIGAALIVSRM